jgi:hypothetical protein
MADEDPFMPNYFKGDEKYGKNYLKDTNDVILEFVWMIGNHMGALCHAIEANTYDVMTQFIII